MDATNDQATPAEATQKPQRRMTNSWPLTVLAILAVIFTLYFAKAIILPVVLATVMALVLAPVMRFLTNKARLPKALAAVIVILAVFGAMGAVGFTVARPAIGWIKKIPESLPALKERFAAVRAPIDFLENGLKELQQASDEASGTQAKAPASDKAEGSHGDGSGMTLGSFTGIAGTVASGTAGIAARFFTTMIVLFFMLVSGDRLIDGFVAIMPGAEDKKRAVTIAHKIEANIAGYLATITAMNAAVGVATGLAMWACGLGTPILWGAMAFALNYVPILGPLAGVGIFFTAGILTLAWPLPAILPAILYFGIHLVEGEAVTPMLLAQRFTLNPLIVILALFFWDGIWGIAGALLAVPLLAVFKIVCDHTDRMRPIGRFIGS